MLELAADHHDHHIPTGSLNDTVNYRDNSEVKESTNAVDAHALRIFKYL